MVQNIEKVLKKAHIPYILACHLQIDADLEPDPAYPDPTFYLMRIHTDPDADPQYCFPLYHN